MKKVGIIVGEDKRLFFNEIFGNPTSHYKVETDNELPAKIIEHAQWPDVEKIRCHYEMRKIACEKFDIDASVAQILCTVDELL